MHFNFELILFYATIMTGVVSLFDIVVLAPRRQRRQVEKLPIVMDYARSFFPVLLLVFLLRAFLFEPFRIPSGSLEPTLLVGDFILVNKFHYGVRLPILHHKIISLDEPKRGDIMVLRWPPNPSIDFIKRVIGVPGDHINYIDRVLYINGQKVPQTLTEEKRVRDEEGKEEQIIEKQEDLFGMTHRIYIHPNRPSRNYYDIVVPVGMYFVMGDNRDDSADSRYWGFVPARNIVGKAIAVWMSWDGAQHTVRWHRLMTVIH